ncbi:hypothetical protein Pcinc_002079 [Petrolisthes cinctipes]|uniref:Uncharacterized protein n=1 Tax=Petrolisthes cinctipes TaxID=88211 RepID=A0AAE1GQN4_PETCI|nr:hypothetical protein Pcinc_002079 [Petrolisthes cinctipes]
MLSSLAHTDKGTMLSHSLSPSRLYKQTFPRHLLHVPPPHHHAQNAKECQENCQEGSSSGGRDGPTVCKCYVGWVGAYPDTSGLPSLPTVFEVQPEPDHGY